MQESWETWVQSLGQEDTPEEEMSTHSSVLTRIIPRTWGHKEPDTTEWSSMHIKD